MKLAQQLIRPADGARVSGLSLDYINDRIKDGSLPHYRTPNIPPSPIPDKNGKFRSGAKSLILVRISDLNKFIPGVEVNGRKPSGPAITLDGHDATVYKVERNAA